MVVVPGEAGRVPAWFGCVNTGLHRAEYGVSLGSDAGVSGSQRVAVTAVGAVSAGRPARQVRAAAGGAAACAAWPWPRARLGLGLRPCPGGAVIVEGSVRQAGREAVRAGRVRRAVLVSVLTA